VPASTVVASVAALFASFGSWFASIVATFVTEAGVDSLVWTTSVTIADPPFSMSPRSHVKVEGASSSQSPWLGVTDVVVVPAVTVSCRSTLMASSSSSAATVIVYVMVPPAVTGSGVSVMATDASPW
jgi:hypothetical protein